MCGGERDRERRNKAKRPRTRAARASTRDWDINRCLDTHRNLLLEVADGVVLTEVVDDALLARQKLDVENHGVAEEFNWDSWWGGGRVSDSGGWVSDSRDASVRSARGPLLGHAGDAGPAEDIELEQRDGVVREQFAGVQKHHVSRVRAELELLQESTDGDAWMDGLWMDDG